MSWNLSKLKYFCPTDLVKYKLVPKCDKYWGMKYYVDFFRCIYLSFYSEIMAPFVGPFKGLCSCVSRVVRTYKRL